MVRKATKRTYVALVLDKSGSMNSVREQTVEGYNQQLRVFRQSEKPSHKSFVLRVFFDGEVEVTPLMAIGDIPDLSYREYDPEGSTAMYDAVGAAIEQLKKIEYGPEDAFLVIVVSDGCENSSRKYNSHQVAEMVKGLQDTKHWTFSYVGANQDLTKVAHDLHIPTGNIYRYSSTRGGTNTAMNAVASSTVNYMSERSRGSTSSVSFATMDENDTEIKDITE